MSVIISTIETCPECQNPEMKVKHGFVDQNNRAVHVEDCPGCGHHVPIFLFTCPTCTAAQQGQAQEFLCKQCQFKAGYAGPGWCYMFMDMFIDCTQRLPVVYPPYAAQQANGADAESKVLLTGKNS